MSKISTNTLDDIKNLKATTLVVEVRSSRYPDTILRSILSAEAHARIKENLAAIKKEKTLIFYAPTKSIGELVCFFPNEEILLDDRSAFFLSLQKDTTFLADGDESTAFGAFVLGTYRFDSYLSKPETPVMNMLVSPDSQKEIDAKIPLLDAVVWARDLINTPPSDSNPEQIVALLQGYAWKNFDMHIFDAKALKKDGCNLLLAVGAGSDVGPYMVILIPKKAPKTEKYALIGKGVTFDAGGIQIKPDSAMFDMKMDMSGAAGMLGVARYLDTLATLPVDVTIAVGLTENMTGGSAYKPLDIYTAYNGTTVEIHHTDAEGRLVLADVMSYVEKNYKPQHIITMATLTGACLYALGYDLAGIMGDDEEVIRQLIDTTSPYEKVWRLPQSEKLKKSLKADIADIKNVTKTEKAGSSVGGAFLSYFQGDAKLTHLDIAGPAYREAAFGYMPKGATGWGVQILSQFLTSLKK